MFGAHFVTVQSHEERWRDDSVSAPPASNFVSSSLCACVLSCVQVSTSRPGGENPSHCPECLQHGNQGGADTAKHYGARKR